MKEYGGRWGRSLNFPLCYNFSMVEKLPPKLTKENKSILFRNFQYDPLEHLLQLI